MPTSRFCDLIGMPERTWRRHQARTRTGDPVKGPWPRPARSRVREAVRAHALAHPAWGPEGLGDGPLRRSPGLPGHRAAAAARRGADPGGQLPRERRELAANRRAAFATAPTGPNEVWQLDFSEFETTSGGTWRIAGCRDYWSKYEHRFHISPTANMHDAIAAVEFALAEAAELGGRPLRDLPSARYRLRTRWARARCRAPRGSRSRRRSGARRPRRSRRPGGAASSPRRSVR